MPTIQNILALDWGEKRIGLALGGTETRIAFPLEVIDRTSQAAVFQRLGQIVRENSINRLLVGLPLNMDDSIGPAARKAAEWGREIAQSLEIPVDFVDERLSSFEAESRLAGRRDAGQKLTRGQKKSHRDALAAAAFLREFLEGKRQAIQVPSQS